MPATAIQPQFSCDRGREPFVSFKIRGVRPTALINGSKSSDQLRQEQLKTYHGRVRPCLPQQGVPQTFCPNISLGVILRHIATNSRTSFAVSETRLPRQPPLSMDWPRSRWRVQRIVLSQRAFPSPSTARLPTLLQYLTSLPPDSLQAAGQCNRECIKFIKD